MIKEEKSDKPTTQLNVRIKDGEQFYSNESSINFNPNEIVLDFKCLTHAHDLADKRAIVVKHNTVILNPFHAKNFLNMLSKAVKDYEGKFGEIKKSESMKKAESIVKKEEKKKLKVEKVKDTIGTYFG